MKANQLLNCLNAYENFDPDCDLTLVLKNVYFKIYTFLILKSSSIPIVRVVVRGLQNGVLRCLHAMIKMLGRTSGYSVELL